MSLKDIIKQESVNKVAYDEPMKVFFHLKYLHKSELQRLTALYSRKTLNKQTRQMEDDFDFDKLKAAVFDKCVMGWEGITYEWLAKHIPIDLELVDPKANFEYSKLNLDDLLEQMYMLDSWLFDAVKDASSHQNEMEEADLKN